MKSAASEIIFRQGNYYAKILADSAATMPSPYSDGLVRLVTMEVCFPRFILAEFNTHRDKSRNSASSRAIPVMTRIKQVWSNPFVPEAFGVNKSGMQASKTLGGRKAALARFLWVLASKFCCIIAWCMAKIEVHKQHANRVIEPWAWHTVVVSGTRWENMFNLRTHKDAQPEMQITARLMRRAFETSVPRILREGEWHLPYVDSNDWKADDTDECGVNDQFGLVKLSVVKSAAVSYERQAAERTVEQVKKRHDDMMRQAHWSPFEHAAKVATCDEIDSFALFKKKMKIDKLDGGLHDEYTPVSIGNFDTPWLQYRKTIPGEDVWHAPE